MTDRVDLWERIDCLMTLVIVESPTKAKTLSRFLGSGYNVEATYGHVTDLPEKKIGVTVKKHEDGKVEFIPEFVNVTKQLPRIEDLKKTAKTADKILLATDPDREGEAIAYHVKEIVESLKGKQPKFDRIVFHEITQKAIDEAVNHPRELDTKLVEAQLARRILDRLVGYKLSPILWRKVRRGLSAGRVQSVALRLVVEREREIEAFVPVEYWKLIVSLNNNQNSMFNVQLTALNEEKIEIGNQEQAAVAESDLRQASYSVASVDKKEFRRTPPAPFTTSTLQQTAANRMGWSAKKTMQVAQSLYEAGNITYHRTDSTNISMEAVNATKEYIAKAIGREYALDKPRFYKTKSKVAQEAHEAIRPTDVNVQSSVTNEQLNKDQAKLYDLIWKRFVACQMAEVAGTSVVVMVHGKEGRKVYGLTARGETISFEGWMRIYQNSNDKAQITNHIQNGDNENGNQQLPELKAGEKLDFVDLKAEQKFTQPPARYSDASLIKALEEKGIGRPSTYAPTLSTIQDRMYVERVEKRFQPTSLGLAVNDFLVSNFADIVDYGFTAQMEDHLDEIATGEREWQPVLADFYLPFEATLNNAAETAKRVKVEVEDTGEKCPKCSEGEVVIRMGRFGKFLACSRYPDCDYKANYVEKIDMACPKCGDGQVIIKRTKSRKSFFGCSNYPKCDFASWTRPTPRSSGASEGAAKQKTG